MGHAKVATTLNVYTQVIDGWLRAAVDRVGSELFAIVHNPEKGAVKRTGIVGGPIPREDVAHGTTVEVLPRTA